LDQKTCLIFFGESLRPGGLVIYETTSTLYKQRFASILLSLPVPYFPTILTMKAIIMGAGDRSGVREAFNELRLEIEKYVEIAAADFQWSRDMSQVDSDIAIVFGGDGSVLRSAHAMKEKQRPVLAVNLGTLGFLANIQTENLLQVLKTLRLDNLKTINHLMLECQIYQGTEVDTRLCLNEVVVFHEQGGFHIVNISLAVDRLPVTTFRCDGLILSTPFGSTGHSLSAGGPIIRKDLDAVVITPISPHSLSQRPVVDSADRIYEMSTVGCGGKVLIDGTNVATITSSDRVVICRAGVSFQMLDLPGHGYYASLRDKLGWSSKIIEEES